MGIDSKHSMQLTLWMTIHYQTHLLETAVCKQLSVTRLAYIYSPETPLGMRPLNGNDLFGNAKSVERKVNPDY